MTSPLDLLTAAEVAAELRVHEETIRDWARTGVLAGAKVGKAWRFTRTDVNAFATGNQAAVDYFATA